MELIKFPSELAVFADRINDHWIAKLQDRFSKIQEEKSALTLNDWYSHVQSVLTQEEQPPSELWALFSKLAWIQADVDFFTEKSEFLIHEAKKHANPLLLCYIGAGITEFIDSEKGIVIVGEAFSLIESQEDWPALLDIGMPYILLLSNSNNIVTFEKAYLTIKRVFREILNSDPEYQHLFIPVQAFAFVKEIEETQIDLLDSLKITQESQHALNTGLIYTLMSHKEKDNSFEDCLENAIQQFRSINANNRLIIAYTNLTHYYASKARYKESSEYLSKAFSLAASLNKDAESGLFIYPLIQKGGLSVERGQLKEAKETYQFVLEKTKNFCCPNYQIKVEFSLAYVYFLESQDDLALSHAQKALSIIEESEMEDSKHKYAIQLKYAELLTDLNRLDEVPEILESIDSTDLKNCSRVYFDYISGKFELNRFNLGIAKKHLKRAMENVEKCDDFRPTLLITIAEGYLHEYRISEDPKILQEAQKMVNEYLEKVVDVPNRAKGQCLLAILLSAQGRDEEAEELLETLTGDSSKSIPRFQSLAEKLLENIRDTRAGSANISPITNIRDVLRYLRDAKTMIESQPR